MNDITSIVSLCNLTKEALWKESMGRIHTPSPCLRALILSSFLFPLDFHLRATLCMILCVPCWICAGTSE